MHKFFKFEAQGCKNVPTEPLTRMSEFSSKTPSRFENLGNMWTLSPHREEQKQPSRGVLRKGCFKNIHQIYRRTPMTKCDLLCNFIEITLRHWCSPVNLLYILRTPFPKNTSKGLLLEQFLQRRIHTPSLTFCIVLNVSLGFQKIYILSVQKTFSGLFWDFCPFLLLWKNIQL